MVTMKLLRTTNEFKNQNQPTENRKLFFKIPIMTLIPPSTKLSYLLCPFTDKQAKIAKDTFAESFHANSNPKVWCCCRNKIDFNLFYCKIYVKVGSGLDLLDDLTSQQLFTF